MNKKIYPLLVLFCVFPFFMSHAQFIKPFSIGFGGGGNMLFGDLSNKPVKYGGHIDLDAHINPFISVGVNAQVGKLIADDVYGRDAENKYIGLNGNIKTRLGQFLGEADNYGLYIMSNKSFLSYLSNFYLGIGLGFVSNDVETYRRQSGNEIVEAYNGKDSSTEMVIPINIGIDFPLGQSLYGPTWAINLNFHQAFSTGDNIDGYSNRFGTSNDSYSYFSLGFKIALFNRK